MEFKRNLDNFPIVWSNFKRTLKNGRVVEFVIKDLSEENFDEAKQIIEKYYCKDEVWSVSMGIADDVNATEEYSTLMLEVMEEKLSLGCFLKDNGKTTLVGVTICFLCDKNEHFKLPEAKTEPINKLFKTISVCRNIECIAKIFNVDRYLYGVGLAVASEYRGLGLAYELLKAREKLTLHIGLSVVGSGFTGKGSQRTAQLAGLTVCGEIDYEEFGRMCDIKFINNPEKMVFAAIKITDDGF